MSMIEIQRGLPMKISDYLHQVLYKLENYNLTDDDEGDLINSLTDDEYKAYLVVMSDNDKSKEIAKC